MTDEGTHYYGDGCAAEYGTTQALADATPPGQHPDVAPPCHRPTGMVKPGYPDYLCQRGAGHPGGGEAMLSSGNRLEWGAQVDFTDDEEPSPPRGLAHAVTRRPSDP